jgi:hypothetical protein
VSKPQEEEHEIIEGVKEDVFEAEPEVIPRPFSSEPEVIYKITPQQEEHLSRLQEKILTIVCTMRNIDYVPLIKATNRDRVTIAQSVNSLVERHFIVKRKENPEYEKSRVIIQSTYLGKDYSVRFLGVNLEDILKVEDNEHISAFLEFIKDISDPLQRLILIQPLKRDLFLLLHEGCINNYRAKENNELIKQKLKQALKSGISQLVMYKNYDAKKLLNKRSIEWLKKLFSNHEIKEFRQSIIQMRDNLIATAKRFPE